jgi:hypothetical protein
MKHSINELTTRPPARKPHGKHAPNPSMPAGDQGGRARVWLHGNEWIASIALGWVFAFACIAITPESRMSDGFQVPVILLTFAIALIAYGVGWKVRDERDRDGRAD